MSEETSIFKSDFTKEAIQASGKGTMAEILGIEILEVGLNSIKARMPVDKRTIQPMGILHGGASVALAETIGSISANGTINHQTQYCVGLEINANHIRSVKSGYVIATSSPLHIGRTTQVWEIKILDEMNRLVCVSRLTIAVLNK